MCPRETGAGGVPQEDVDPGVGQRAHASRTQRRSACATRGVCGRARWLDASVSAHGKRVLAMPLTLARYTERRVRVRSHSWRALRAC